MFTFRGCLRLARQPTSSLPQSTLSHRCQNGGPSVRHGSASSRYPWHHRVPSHGSRPWPLVYPISVRRQAAQTPFSTMASIQILSDLHLEAPKSYDTFTIPAAAPYLALLGDIGTVGPHAEAMLAFLRQQLQKFKAVLFVPGNHEAYRSDWDMTLSILRGFEAEARDDAALGTFVLLDRGVFRVPESRTIVLGCSLFSRVPPERRPELYRRLNDFHAISGWDVDSHNAAHGRDLAWLNEQVAQLEGEDVEIVILSHWAPSQDTRATEPRHAGSSIMSAFSTDLSSEPCFRSAKVKVWAFGHTHYNCDFEVQRDGGAGPLRVVTNQRGYYFAQAEGYNVVKVIKLD